ncbi:MAG TPA: phage portal protein [Pirellulales bacterium]|nr:phage portal protein [Pirellulales bacterium]
MILDQLLSAVYPAGPLDDYWYTSVGKVTTAGVNIDESTGLNFSACWAATRILCTSAWLPLNFFELMRNGNRRQATEHRVWRLINVAFNPDVRAIMGRAAGINQQVNWGNFCAEIERDGRGNPLALWPIHASRVQYYYTKDYRQFFYKVTNRDGSTTDLLPNEMFHVPSMMSDDGIIGKGVIRHARETIGASLAAERYGAGWFGSGGRPSGVLKHPAKMSKEGRDNLRREWNEIYGGPGSTHKVAVLWENMEYKSIGVSPEDSQFLATREFSIEEIARWYGVNPHLIQQMIHARTVNIEQLGLEFVKYSLLAWQRQWEDEIERKLLLPSEQGRFIARHDVDELERGDLTTRTAANAQQFFNGALTINQWMQKENRDPIGPDGDVHFVQSAMIPLKDAVTGEHAAQGGKAGGASDNQKMPAKGDLSSGVSGQLSVAAHDERRTTNATMLMASLEVLAEIIGVMVERESREAIQAARKPADFLTWLDSFYNEHTARLQKALAKPIRACLLAAGKPCVVDEFVVRAVKSHIDCGREALLNASGVQPEQLGESVQRCVRSWQRPEISNLFLNGDNHGNRN